MSFKKSAFLLIFFFAPVFFFAYERVPVTLNFKSGGELHTSFYCFNELSEGKQIAQELFQVKKYDELAKNEREKMMPVPFGTNVALYDWAIFCYGEEFWLFEVKNGWLWGRGMLLDFPR
ncbi:MAG: hypothetical protein IJ158_12495 [Treponema sp.]|nr:hypothetical protein [Treponema sp.]